MEMNFHSLKRRELQALCKKHDIPANLTNLEMADRLAVLLAVNEKPLTRCRPGRRSCLRVLGENVSEIESDLENRPAKKVRFSPENEMIEFEKSKVRYFEIRGRGRRKSVMFGDKGNAVAVTSGHDRVNEEIRELRRPRRGKLSEGSENESKGWKRATKLDALRDNGIADNMVNGEVRETRRSRRWKSVEVNEVDTGEKKAADIVEDHGTIDAMVNGEVKEVGRSRRVKFSEGSEVESKAAKRVTKGAALKDNGNVDDALNEEVREVRRSRRGKFTAGSDALKGKLSAAGDVPSGNLHNEEQVVVKKQLLSKRGVPDEERRENEGVGKGSKNDSSVRSLRSRKEAGTESVCVQLEAGARRSKRHVAKVGDKVQPSSKNATKNKNVRSGRSRSKTALEVEENSGLDDISKTVNVEEGSLVEGKLRRSQRNASKQECSVRMQSTDVVTIAKDKKVTKKRRDAGLEGDTVATDEGNSNGKLSRQITRNTKRSGRVVPNAETEKRGQKQGTLTRSNIEVEDSSTVDIPAAANAQAASTEAPMDAGWADCVNAELSTSVTEFESTIPAESNFSMQKQGEIFTLDERNEGNGSKTTTHISRLLTAENYCIDGNLEHVNDDLDKEQGADVEKGMLENSQGKEREQAYMEELNSSEPENSPTQIDACEVGRSSGCSSHYLSATVTYFKHHEMSSFEDSKPDENGNPKIALQKSEELLEPNSLDAIGGSAARVLLDGGVNCDDDIIYPSDTQGGMSVSTEPSANAAETATEFSGTVYDSKSVESPITSHRLELGVEECNAVCSETHLEISTQSPNERNRGVETKLNEFEEFGQPKPLADELDCSFESQELNSSVRTKFSGVQDNADPGNGDAVAVPDLEHSLQYNELNDVARTNFSIVQVEDPRDDGDPFASCAVEREILCLHGESTHITVGSAGTELERSSSKSCLRSNSPQRFSPVLTHQRSEEVCSEVEIKDDSVLMETFFMMKTPSSGDIADIEKCTASMDTGLNPVADPLDKQSELMMEGIDKKNYDCEGATYIGMHEAYVGQEEPMDSAKTDSNEVKSPHHLIALTEDSREDPEVAYGRKFSPSADTSSQKEGDKACFDGGSKEQTNSVPALPIIQTPPSNNDDGLERSDRLLNERSNWATEVVNDDIGSVPEDMERKRNCFSDWKADQEREIQENVQGEEGSNTIESEAADSALEFDGCPLHAEQNALQNSNNNEQVQTSELPLTEAASIPNSMLEENASDHENEMGLSISMGREERDCQFDEKSTKEEQEKEGSSCDGCVDVDKDEKTGMTEESIFTNAFEETNEDELRMLFGISITSYENATLQDPDICALHDSSLYVASAEETEGLLLEESDGTLQQPDEQKIDAGEGYIDDLGSRLFPEALNYDERAESGVPPAESKTDDSFSLDHTRNDEEEWGTSVAMLFETQENVQHLNKEETISDIQEEPAALESSGFKHHSVFNDSEVAELDSLEGDLLTKVVEFVPLPQQETVNAEDPDIPAGEVVPLVQTEAGSVEDPENPAGEVVPLVHPEAGSVEEPDIPGGEYVPVVQPEAGSIEDPNIPAREFVPLVQTEAGGIEEPDIPAREFIPLVQLEAGNVVEPVIPAGEFVPLVQPEMASVEEPFIPAGVSVSLAQPETASFEEPDIPAGESAPLVQPEAENVGEPVIPAGESVSLVQPEAASVEEPVIPAADSVSLVQPVAASVEEPVLPSGEFVPLVQPEAASVEEPVLLAGEDNAPDKGLDQGKVADLFRTESKSISRTAGHQCAANADEALEPNLVSHLKIESSRSKNLGAEVHESISSAAKYTPKRKNARTILIHATPNKLQMAAYMKENAPISKPEKAGSLTSVRPTVKRSALTLKRTPWK